MAEIPMNGTGQASGTGKSIGTMTNWAGAALSLALIVGAGVWGYRILVRDVSGVPVVQAVEGPMRIQPDDPGGQLAAHQGLAVNRVAAKGSAAAPADRLVLAPPPIDLNSEDQPITLARAKAAPPPVVDSEALSAPKQAAPQEIKAPPPLSAGQVASIEALAAEIAAGADTLSQPAPAATKAPSANTASKPAAVKPKTGLARSLRPQLRPERGGKPLRVASAAPTAQPAVAVSADRIPAGTRLVQLGAFASPEIAVREWDKLTGRFGDILVEKKRVIQKATSGGRIFYRLRAMGFADLSDARRVCSALKAENADCIPVVTR